MWIASGGSSSDALAGGSERTRLAWAETWVVMRTMKHSPISCSNRFVTRIPMPSWSIKRGRNPLPLLYTLFYRLTTLKFGQLGFQVSDARFQAFDARVIDDWQCRKHHIGRRFNTAELTIRRGEDFVHFRITNRAGQVEAVIAGQHRHQFSDVMPGLTPGRAEGHGG